MMLSRLDDSQDTNAGYRIIAAIRTKDVVNGMPVYYVTGQDDMYSEYYVTWRMSWTFTVISDTENKTTREWRKCYESGNYFESGSNGATARDRAFLDMANRANGIPAEFAQSVTKRPESDIDHKTLPSWAITKLWPEFDTNLDNINFIVSVDTMREVLDLIDQNKKIQAIKAYRDAVIAGLGSCGLLEAKRTIDAVAGQFFPSRWNWDGTVAKYQDPYAPF